MSLEDKAKKLPLGSGVYFFLDKNNKPLYIGRATSLRSRASSYFKKGLDSRIVEMIARASQIKYKKTDSVLEAIILEANLIKKHQPKYNIKEKDDKSFNYVVITDEDFPRVMIVRGKDLLRRGASKWIFGPFPEAMLLKKSLKIIRKIFPFRDKCLPASGRACFNNQIGLCPGVCSGDISKKDYTKIIKNLKLFFNGKKKDVLKNLKKEMLGFAKKYEFEKSNEIKRKIFALEHIQDIALLTASPLGGKAAKWKADKWRIEAYDVSHISGKFTVGAMVVVADGKPKSSEYRLFKIKKAKSGSDTGALQEILERRIKHKEWEFPDLIVVDGGVAQRNIAMKILKNSKVNILVAGVVKDKRHKQSKIIGPKRVIEKYKKVIFLSNLESHRFAQNYHKKLRSVL